MKITRIVTVNQRYKFSLNANDKCLVCNTYLRVIMVFWVFLVVFFITRVAVVIFMYYLGLDQCCIQQLCTGANFISLPGHGQ